MRLESDMPACVAKSGDQSCQHVTTRDNQDAMCPSFSGSLYESSWKVSEAQ